MSLTPLTVQQFQEIYKNVITSERPELSDFSPGSLNDIISGAFGIAMNELSELLISEFRKTYIKTAESSDLDYLATDHFGSRFERSQGTKAYALLTFSRKNANFGDVLVPQGTICETLVDQLTGESVEFETIEDVHLTGLSVEIKAECLVVGKQGNVSSSKVTRVTSSLSDSSITATNALRASGGSAPENDGDFRERIYYLLSSLTGATKNALKSTILGLPEISNVSIVEQNDVVISYDLQTRAIKANSNYFRIPRPIIYVSGPDGGSSDEMINSALLAIEPIRAAGIYVEVSGARTTIVNIKITSALNSEGQNYASLSGDLSPIQTVIRDYLNGLAIGEGFSKNSIATYILSVFGPDGSDDITSITVDRPLLDISPVNGVKLLSGTVEVV